MPWDREPRAFDGRRRSVNGRAGRDGWDGAEHARPRELTTSTVGRVSTDPATLAPDPARIHGPVVLFMSFAAALGTSTMYPMHPAIAGVAVALPSGLVRLQDVRPAVGVGELNMNERSFIVSCHDYD